ncbi:putative photosynthetic complex assembly protein PuhE [Salinarimonas rosea]|uniref:putative photosynthetic complex assembly protein PuhE n=1 Tax=Salinarimonas rosea TaxID=552063 RepID=UPI000403D4B0|nr:putative photosynthetic complex assembly protein PuhE [Salinarimonas rosea]
MTMVLVAAGFALFAWWASTGLILMLDRLPRWTFAWTMAGATALTALAVWGLAWSAQQTSVAAALCAFACALVVWGWTEVSFLTGWITGPRTTASPPGTRGLARLRHAIAAIIWHELAILAGFLVVLAVTWGGENQTATATYAVLWIMRLSAKINIFLGVPNHADGFLPEHLAYLKSWFTRRAMNPFFPVSVSAALVVLALVAAPVFAPETGAFEGASRALVATLLALAIVEHWFLVLPFESIALWRLPSGEPRAGESSRDALPPSLPAPPPGTVPTPLAAVLPAPLREPVPDSARDPRAPRRPVPRVEDTPSAFSLWRR